MVFAASLLFAILLPGGDEGRAGPDGAGGGHDLRVYKVWAFDGEEKKVPRELEKFAKQLRKSTKKKCFRLDEKPFAATLRPEQPVAVKLPERYLARFTLKAEAGGKTAVLQALVNPKNEVSQILLRKSPVITEIRKLEKEGQSFFLIVEFEPARS